MYSGILSSRAGTAAVKTIPIHDLVSDTIKGRRTAGITAQIDGAEMVLGKICELVKF